MSRVDLSSAHIDEIVLNEEGVPGIDEVYGKIVSDFKITVQSKEPLEGTVDRVVEGDCIQTIIANIAKEILAVARGDVESLC